MGTDRGQGWQLTLLICRVGTRLCGVPLAYVVETMRPLPVEPLAHLPSFVDGLSLIRGRPTPVLDARRLLGANDQPSALTRYVTLALGERFAALAVDAVLGIRDVDVGRLDELPPLLRDAQTELVRAIGTLDDQLLFVLERSRLVPQAVWATVEAEAMPA